MVFSFVTPHTKIHIPQFNMAVNEGISEEEFIRRICSLTEGPASNLLLRSAASLGKQPDATSRNEPVRIGNTSKARDGGIWRNIGDDDDEAENRNRLTAALARARGMATGEREDEPPGGPEPGSVAEFFTHLAEAGGEVVFKPAGKKPARSNDDLIAQLVLALLEQSASQDDGSKMDALRETILQTVELMGREPGAVDVEEAIVYFRQQLLDKVPAEDFAVVCEVLETPRKAVVFNSLYFSHLKRRYLNSLIATAKRQRTGSS
ncbi:hypothetical protein GGR52DRAFT_550584 [Hypoxylon sp. FL1284]|nr:hypothetical protein GGR52DRAFT_550584 [Hypoxylon sp. FL1284]